MIASCLSSLNSICGLGGNQTVTLEPSPSLDKITGSRLSFLSVKTFFDAIDVVEEKQMDRYCIYSIYCRVYIFHSGLASDKGVSKAFRLTINDQSYEAVIFNYTHHTASLDQTGSLLLNDFLATSEPIQLKMNVLTNIYIFPFKDREDLIYVGEVCGSIEEGKIIFLDKEKNGLVVSWIGNARNFVTDKFHHMQALIIPKIEKAIHRKKIFELLFLSLSDEKSAFACLPKELIHYMGKLV